MKKLYEWLDSLWQLVSGKVFVRFEYDLPVETIRKALQEGRLIFAVPTGGMIEWLILSSWCRLQGFGAILVSNRKRILWLSKPLYFLQILFKNRTYANLFSSAEPGPRLLFCPPRERKTLMTPTPVEKLLSDVQAASAESGVRFTVVTVLILWRRHARGASRRPSEYLLGMHSAPNLMGKVWYLARKRMDSMVRGLEPFVMGSKDASEGGDFFEEGEAMRIARVTRRKILVLHKQEMRVILGPTYRTPLAVKEEILKDPSLQALIQDLSEKEGTDRKRLMARSYRDLTEIVANYSYRFIEVMYVMLTWLFTRVFEGLEVEEKDLLEVREVMKHKPVVFIPCHRSHLDYLVIPYVLFMQDMVTPHIAAGVNLAFWPVGGLLRRGGAFFIRRSFRGDPLYSLALKKYVEYLLAHRYNIKFFIEGTRSRSGKMLAPAYGMLKMVMETYLRNAIDDIALVPVSICYDEVPEQGSYTKELAGGQKEKESAGALIRSRKIAKRNFGKVYVHFARPLYARELLAREESPAVDEVSLALQKAAFHISKSINDVTPVTPKSLVSTVLLSHRIDAISLEDLLRTSLLLADYVEASGHLLSVPRGEGLRRAIESTLRSLQKSGVVNISSSVPRTFFCENKKRILLAYYKNNGVHCLVSPSITILAAFASLKDPRDETLEIGALQEKAKALRDLLKFEFFFSPTGAFLDEMRRNLSFFLGEPLGERREIPMSRLRERFEDWDDLSVFLRMSGDILEAYATCLDYIQETSLKSMDAKAFPQKVLAYGEGKSQKGGIAFPESLSVQLYTNALLWLGNRNLVTVTKAESKSVVTVDGWSPGLEEARSELRTYLRLMEDFPDFSPDQAADDSSSSSLM